MRNLLIQASASWSMNILPCRSNGRNSKTRTMNLMACSIALHKCLVRHAAAIFQWQIGLVYKQHPPVIQTWNSLGRFVCPNKIWWEFYYFFSRYVLVRTRDLDAPCLCYQSPISTQQASFYLADLHELSRRSSRLFSSDWRKGRLVSYQRRLSRGRTLFDGEISSLSIPRFTYPSGRLRIYLLVIRSYSHMESRAT